MTTLPTRIALSAVAALSLAGGLAACASEPEAPVESDNYADGEYTTRADYRSPGGTEKIGVTLTLTDNVITELEVIGKGTTPEAIRYQKEFSEGVGEEAIGKPINDVTVDRVAGSSLTSGGFMKALDIIKGEAAA